jgi:hypothetical protein
VGTQIVTGEAVASRANPTRDPISSGRTRCRRERRAGADSAAVLASRARPLTCHFAAGVEAELGSVPERAPMVSTLGPG